MAQVADNITAGPANRIKCCTVKHKEIGQERAFCCVVLSMFPALNRVVTMVLPRSTPDQSLVINRQKER
jgi:hypothetical protein